MDALRYWLNYPARWWHRQGFGVQSPWAYELVTDVLFERLRYYVFDEIGGTPQEQQIFRLVNWLKPQRIILEDVSATGRRFALAAQPGLAIVALSEEEIGEEVCVVMDGIRGKNKDRWLQLLLHPKTTSTFDLGNRGLVFFDHCRQRQNYRL